MIVVATESPKRHVVGVVAPFNIVTTGKNWGKANNDTIIATGSIKSLVRAMAPFNIIVAAGEKLGMIVVATESPKRHVVRVVAPFNIVTTGGNWGIANNDTIIATGSTKSLVRVMAPFNIVVAAGV
jgi:hypothetical protein